MREKMTFMYLFFRQLFRIMFRLVYRWRIIGRQNVPLSGGAIIAPNHISWFDPPATGCALKRPLYFMAKKELFDIPIFGRGIKQTNAFPVKRGAHDMAAMRNAFSLLESGKLLLMFPEGTRSKNGNLGKARAGAGMVACNAKVPLIPVKIENTDKMFRFKKIKIIFGEPIYPPQNFTKNDYVALSQKVLDAVEKL